MVKKQQCQCVSGAPIVRLARLPAPTDFAFFFTIETTDQVVNLLTGEATATYLFTAANGDELVVQFDFLALPTPTGFTLNGSWEITDGTGRFANATGSGTTEGRADFTGLTDGVGSFTMTGTISSPDSLE